MAHLIDKDALVAEIKNLLKPVKQRLERDKNDPWDSDIAVYKFGIQLIKNIDTLEVKEVDLKKEYKDFVEEDPVYNKLVNGIVGKAIAKHFFELGISVSNKAQKREDVDAQINSQNEAMKQLNRALNSMEHGGHLPLVEDNMISDKYINGKEPEIVDIDDLPLDACNIQYASIDDAIKAHAEDYSFNIESKLFQQLTPEQQKLWRKEIEQACISGGYSGLNLAKDSRYKENLEVKEIDVDVGSPESDLGRGTVQVIDADGNITEEIINKAQKGE